MACCCQDHGKQNMAVIQVSDALPVQGEGTTVLLSDGLRDQDADSRAQSEPSNVAVESVERVALEDVLKRDEKRNTVAYALFAPKGPAMSDVFEAILDAEGSDNPRIGMGVALRKSVWGPALEVKCLMSGLATAWNDQADARAHIQVGDFIVAIDGGPATIDAVRIALGQRGQVRLLLLRGRPRGPWSADSAPLHGGSTNEKSVEGQKYRQGAEVCD